MEEKMVGLFRLRHQTASSELAIGRYSRPWKHMSTSIRNSGLGLGLFLTWPQLTEAGLQEPLVCALKRADSETHLPESPLTSFYNTSSSYYKLIESQVPFSGKHPLAVSENLADVIRSLHRIWHIDLTNPGKAAGWGRKFDIRSDKLFGDAGKILSESGSTDEMYNLLAVLTARSSLLEPEIIFRRMLKITLANFQTR